MMDDSWGYLYLAYTGNPISFTPDRPSGYPVMIRVLGSVGRDLGIVTTTQHLLGLAVGILVYMLLVQLGANRWVATVVAALVLLDGYVIAMEQYLMAETLFTLCLVLSAYLAAAPPVSRRRLAGSGLMLGLACIVRGAGLFAVPIWLVYILWRRVGGRALVAFLLALAAPILVYNGLQGLTSNGSAFANSDGWFLYGRVAGFANCSDPDIPVAARPLCPRGRQRGQSPDWYVWRLQSPANRMFPAGATSFGGRANSLLRSFAVAVIRDQPATYVNTIVNDTRLYFNTGSSVNNGGGYWTLMLPTAQESEVSGVFAQKMREEYTTGTWPHVQFPASLMRGYERAVHSQGWLLEVLAVAWIVAMLSTLIPRGRRILRRRREVFLLGGSALALMVGTVATVNYNPRFVLPAIPFLLGSGGLLLTDLLSSRPSWGISQRVPKKGRLRPRASAESQ